MQKKPKPVVLSPEMKAYVERVTKVFSARNSYRHTSLRVEFELGTRWYPLKQRFTEDYGNRIYSKLKPLQGSTLHSFWSLTTTVDGTLTGFYQVNARIKRAWMDFRSLWAKDVKIDGEVVAKGMKGVDYLRVFELTDNFGLHVHIAFFTPIDHPMMVKLIDYWNRKHGWVKVFAFTGHTIQYERSEVSEIMHHFMSSDGFDYGRTMAWGAESWVYENGEIKFNEAEWVNAGSIVIQYVYKYMVKIPSIEKQAVLTDAHIRTYACSKNVNGWLSSMAEDWKNEHKEELGNVLETGLEFIPWIEAVSKSKNLWRKLRFRWKYSYIVEIVFPLDEEYKNFIVIPTDIRFNGTVAVLTVRSERSVYRAERGFNTTILSAGSGFPDFLGD